MLNNLRIGKRLGFGFGLIVLILIGAVAVGVLGFQRSLTTLKQVKSQTAQIILAQDAHAHFLQTMTCVGAVAAAQDPASTETYVQQVEAERAAYIANLDQIAPLNITAASQRIFGELTTAIAAVRETNGKVLELAKAGKHGEAGLLFDAEGDLTVQARVDCQDEICQLGGSLNLALNRLQSTMRETSQASQSVASGAVELSASAEQMAATTAEIARSGETLNQATESVAAAIVQFLGTVEQVAGNVKVSVEQTDQAMAATAAGAQGSEDAGARMVLIQEATGKIASAVAVIQEIAQQTSLLSLNAAIEAAKAGELGKGFSVVADEVRKLADRSGEAAVEIEHLIKGTRDAVEGGAASVRTTAERMTQIQAATVKVAQLIRQIGSTTTEQSGTAGEIGRRMEESAREVGQNATATHQLSATVQEISRTAAELARISETMAQATAKFKV